MGVDHVDTITALKQEIEQLRRDVRRLSKMTIQNASVGRDGIRVYDGGKITIEDGGLEVTGTATVIGVLTGSGDLVWTGPVTISGNTDITGDVDLTGDLNVISTGRVKIGTITLDPSTDGGRIDFGSNRVVKVAGAAFGIYNANASLVLNTAANLVGPGCSFVAGATPSITGLPTRTRALSNNAVVGTVWTDGSQLYRVVT